MSKFQHKLAKLRLLRTELIIATIKLREFATPELPGVADALEHIRAADEHLAQQCKWIEHQIAAEYCKILDIFGQPMCL